MTVDFYYSVFMSTDYGVVELVISEAEFIRILTVRRGNEF